MPPPDPNHPTTIAAVNRQMERNEDYHNQITPITRRGGGMYNKRKTTTSKKGRKHSKSRRPAKSRRYRKSRK
jgi:hypothetical protein